MRHFVPETEAAERGTPSDKEVTELPLLIGAREAAALEEEARRRGLTLARLLRALVRGFLAQAGPGREGEHPGPAARPSGPCGG
jgi:hypothetical protein